MSANKQKYFEVTATYLVRANNMTDAMRRVEAPVRRSVPDTDVLSGDITANRISATDARSVYSEEVFS